MVNNMKFKFSLVNLCAMIFLFFNISAHADNSKLADSHKKAGVECKQCHESMPPKMPTSQDACISCHGNSDKRKQVKIHEGEDRVLEMNIHQSHVGDLRCGVCHSSHKESKLYCNEACHHRFDTKVP